MSTTATHSQVRAVYHQGVLTLLDPVELPEGARVRLSIQSITSAIAEVRPTVPTRLIPAEKLDSLTGLVEVGGDALPDSEALYDPPPAINLVQTNLCGAQLTGSLLRRRTCAPADTATTASVARVTTNPKSHERGAKVSRTWC